MAASQAGGLETAAQVHLDWPPASQGTQDGAMAGDSLAELRNVRLQAVDPTMSRSSGGPGVNDVSSALV